ncbi:flagellar biosynthesis protein FlgD [Herbaspirillum sp. meg3]|uniref:flagellar hook assembly protein FlgD n=1 Tax=Herbaspirillum sp. meg3 TaxID=2025949 RepID=UPI000B989575|nr:flagellar hook assembly protein FlgD [Herbaspirillum sp. meg3]ASU38275.1 flagellar biosynthesis protein FlgD [Herbaspirillum sp. meg3]
MTTVSSDLLAAVNGSSSSTSTTSSLNDNSPEAIQQRFLKLLTVQMQNQDPTNPMDNSQLTTQLAQLSTVSGISQLNTTLAALMSNLGTSQSLQAANMIGHSVLAPGNNVTLTSDTTKDASGNDVTTQKAIFGVQLADNADSVKVTIRDSAGNVVHSLDLGAQTAGTLPIIWNGATDAGTQAKDGAYTFTVSATSAGSAVGATALAFGTVASVSTGTDGVKLNVSNIGTIKTTDVVQIL